MNNKVLFVDDDPNILAAVSRQLRRAFAIETALGGEAALERLHDSGPYAVVVADMRMPGIDGVALLKEVRALSPKTVRIMLTGNADQRTAMDAVNHGAIFRFLTKPCPSDTLAQALQDAISQYRLQLAEAELLEKTLVGAVKMLTEILSATDPEAFGRSVKLRQLASTMAVALGLEDRWQIEMAAMLAHVGRIGMRSKTRPDTQQAEPTPVAADQAAQVAANLIRMIPRMESVATIVSYSRKNFSGAGLPQDGVAGEQIPLASRLLRILDDLLELEDEGKTRSTALRIMTSRYGWYDPQLLDTVHQVLVPPLPSVAIPGPGSSSARVAGKPGGLHGVRRVAKGICDLKVGDVLVEAAQAYDGTFLLTAGQVVTNDVITRLKEWDRNRGVREPLIVAPR